MKTQRSTSGAVVVPAVDSASSTCVLRSLGRRGIRTIAASFRDTPPAFRSKYCDDAVRVPSYRDDVVAYKDALLSLARRPSVRTVFPLQEMDTYVLSRYRSEFAEHLDPVWPTMETLADAQDRLRLVEAAESAGVAVPETRLLDEVEDWTRKQIVKARYTVLTDAYVDSFSPDQYRFGGSTRYLRSGVEPDREAIRAESGHVPIVQEYVPGDEYALWALYDEGDPVATCGKRQRRAYSWAGGTSICRETTDDPQLEAAGRALLDELDWHGPASVQFVKDEETGEFTLLEINPRFWVSLSCPVRAGLDFPQYFWQLASGESVAPSDDYETGVATHLLRGEAVHLHSVLTEEFPYENPPSFSAKVREVTESVARQPNFDYLTLDDPGPFVRDALNQVSSVGGSLRGVLSPDSDGDATTAPDV
ncbi:carboxylate--amine ligase [Halorussus pelagicus]|uniref:carboxylate--amine ligase n=1 Tax=Halorussus pelagicus TaxID=2505977 RepID=UPI000FFB63F3|nr:ATP-grasp domain-containing protein [Halorussus pelagicus]